MPAISSPALVELLMPYLKLVAVKTRWEKVLQELIASIRERSAHLAQDEGYGGVPTTLGAVPRLFMQLFYGQMYRRSHMKR